MQTMTQADADTAMAARQIVSTIVPRETMKPLMVKMLVPAMRKGVIRRHRMM
jgi:hypothetical protein